MDKDNKPIKEVVSIETDMEKDIDQDKKITAQKSLQSNRQDLDQEQNVNTNPFQFNSQNVHIVVDDYKKDYSGKITGITYSRKDNHIISSVIISLYFGRDTEVPIYKTTSDKDGNFVIANIPPGYYTLKAYLGEDFIYSSNYIKILPCENVNHPIFLEYYYRRQEVEDRDWYFN